AAMMGFATNCGDVLAAYGNSAYLDSKYLSDTKSFQALKDLFKNCALALAQQHPELRKSPRVLQRFPDLLERKLPWAVRVWGMPVPPLKKSFQVDGLDELLGKQQEEMMLCQ